MKRFIVTILSILYLAGATNATVHLHYCMGKFAGVSISYNNADSCGTCGMKKPQKKSCCRDEHTTFRTGDHQSASASFELMRSVAIPLPIIAYKSEPAPIRFTSALRVYKTDTSPPGIASYPIYIRVQNFRI